MRLSTIPVTCKIRKPRPREVVFDWPFIRISDWAAVLLHKNPQYMLGGFKVEEDQGWRRLLSGFWDTYASIDDAHPVFSTNLDPSTIIPFALHGDEGRGLRFKPFLVESFQTVIGCYGPSRTNESGHLSCKYECHAFPLYPLCITLGMGSGRLNPSLQAFFDNEVPADLHLLCALCRKRPDAS